MGISKDDFDLCVNLSGVELSNPVIPASGTFGYGKEMSLFYDLNILGALSFKGTTREPREGNSAPRIAECDSGMLNSIGLQNPGIDAVIEKELAQLKTFFYKPVIANISGFSIDDYVYSCEKADKCGDIAVIEVNISCPNVHDGGMSFGRAPQTAAEVTRAVKEVTKKPVYMKLTPNVGDIGEIALACEDAGADGISLINTLIGMRIDIKRREPVLGNKKGGLSGPAIFPVALAMVHETAQKVSIPIIGMGGVKDAAGVIEMMMAGASAVGVGAQNLVNPLVCKEIIEELPDLMDELGIKSLKEIIGCVK